MFFFSKKGPNTILKWPFSWAKNWFNYVAQHTWTNFRLRLGPILDIFKTSWNHYFYSAFSVQLHSKRPPPKIRTTICEHNCANRTRSVVPFSAFLFWVFCCVWLFFFHLFGGEEWKSKWTQIQNKTTKRNKTTRCKQEHHFVLLYEKKKADNTDIKQYNLIVKKKKQEEQKHKAWK